MQESNILPPLIGLLGTGKTLYIKHANILVVGGEVGIIEIV